MRVTHLTEQLDPDHAATPVLWLTDQDGPEIAMDALRWGESYSLAFSDDQAVYVFTVQPGTGSEPVLPGRESAWPM
ncbi:hypothetical protein FB465_1979 [Kitasatospora atroaurantiaca]|uniref:Uncharacterized protein n=1 Tax=Kitasatospora atroaurantiaca TaxID=285545 RepID=A0A561EMZ7_9ACTN|nr:hypothetical protein FB465_1979 [Kitasatospora atroaurantiaca]